MAVNRVSGLVLPASTKFLIDDVIGKRNVSLLLPLVSVAAAFLLALGLLSFGRLGAVHAEPPSSLFAGSGSGSDVGRTVFAATDAAGSGSAAIDTQPIVVAPPVVMNPTIDGTLLGYMMSGQYMLAVGAALVALVALLRAGLATRITFFTTTLGGYILGFGTSSLAYVGAALKSGAPITMALAATSLVAGFAASGKWEALRDVLTSLRKPAVAAAARAAVTTAAIVALMIGVSWGASTGCKDVKGAGQAVVDCTVLNQSKLEALAATWFGRITSGTESWAALEADAESEGGQIAACALAEVVQKYLGGDKATPAEASWQAHEALEKMRTANGGATFHTATGDL